MQKFLKSIALASILVSSSAITLSAAQNKPVIVKSTLSEAEKEDLLFMREEEKLAGDVYQYFYDLYGKTVFANIHESEVTHTEAIKSLLDKYNLEDPALPSAGEFTDQELQSLYNSLISTGEESLEQALRVGAAIEEIDMIDINKAIDRTDNADIEKVYGNLIEGSKSHLRAFVYTLEGMGITYYPQYISEEEFTEIMNEI